MHCLDEKDRVTGSFFDKYIFIYNNDYITIIIFGRTAMPPKVKITKKMVADAAFELVKTSGHENLNARTISEYLECSTQPVLYSFKTMDEIREAACNRHDSKTLKIFEYTVAT